MIQKGFLIISDITGYSAYLNESELEHARDSLTDLLNILIDHTKSPLIISKLEGDAVFSYVNKGGIQHSQTMIETMENTYAAFRKALDLMIINTSCNCNACRNLPNLDLKFFIHYGQFSVQKIGNYAELVGNDVNLVHRLVKNSVTKEHEVSAYALYTRAVVEALKDSSIFDSMPMHEEAYPDVGKVDGFVQDMHEIWDKKKNEMRVVVTEEEAMLVVDFDYPVPPMILWNYITNPQYRAILYDSDYQEFDNRIGGRTGVDTIYVCAHGDTKLIHTVLDWQPFEQLTTNETLPLPGISANYTYRIFPTDSGSKLVVYCGKATGSWPLREIARMMSKRYIKSNFATQAGNLRREILKDLEEGKTSFQPSIKINPDLITTAVGDALVSQESGK